jgi:hypothetical protein
MYVDVACKLTIIFLKLSQFSFGTMKLKLYNSAVINNRVSLFDAVKNTRIAEFLSDSVLPNIGPYS